MRPARAPRPPGGWAEAASTTTNVPSASITIVGPNHLFIVVLVIVSSNPLFGHLSSPSVLFIVTGRRARLFPSGVEIDMQMIRAVAGLWGVYSRQEPGRPISRRVRLRNGCGCGRASSLGVGGVAHRTRSLTSK